MKTKNRKQSKVAKRRSMKGKRGSQVGAPPKAFRLPNNTFTMATAFNSNKNQCHLSVRKKVDAMLADGSLTQLASRKQAGGGVGRPKAVFIKTENFDATKHVRLNETAPAAQTVAVPLTAPAPEAPAPVAETPAPTEPANVTQLPETPVTETAPEAVAA